MGSKEHPPGSQKLSLTDKKVCALRDSIDEALADDEVDETERHDSANGLEELTPDEKAFVNQFSQLDTVKRLLADKGASQARRSRLRRKRSD